MTITLESDDYTFDQRLENIVQMENQAMVEIPIVRYYIW